MVSVQDFTGFHPSIYRSGYSMDGRSGHIFEFFTTYIGKVEQFVVRVLTADRELVGFSQSPAVDPLAEMEFLEDFGDLG